MIYHNQDTPRIMVINKIIDSFLLSSVYVFYYITINLILYFIHYVHLLTTIYLGHSFVNLTNIISIFKLSTSILLFNFKYNDNLL